MYKLRENKFALISCFFSIFTFISAQLITVSVVNAAFSDTTVAHKPIKYFVPDHRIVLNVMVQDSTGVDLVRCYFREAGQTDFTFVTMNHMEHDTYQGVLPRPSNDSMSLQYRFLIVNNAGEVIDTQTYTVPFFESESIPGWQVTEDDTPLTVHTELIEAPRMLFGFADNIDWNVVSASDRYGFMADGLYSESSIKAVELAEERKLTAELPPASVPPVEPKASVDDTAQSMEAPAPPPSPSKARTVTATEKSSSTGKLLGIGILGAAAVAGAAAAGGGGGGGGSKGGGGGAGPTTQITSCPSEVRAGAKFPVVLSIRANGDNISKTCISTGSCSNLNPAQSYRFTWNMAGRAKGRYNFGYWSYDTKGRRGNTANCSVNVR